MVLLVLETLPSHESKNAYSNTSLTKIMIRRISITRNKTNSIRMRNTNSSSSTNGTSSRSSSTPSSTNSSPSSSPCSSTCVCRIQINLGVNRISSGCFIYARIAASLYLAALMLLFFVFSRLT